MKPTRILLIGGGHSHIEVVRQYRKLFNGLDTEMVLVSPDPGAAYSGMLPGVVAGHYQIDQALINLPALCEDAGVGWHQGRFLAMNEDGRSALLEDGHSIDFDFVSLDIGSVPAQGGMTGAVTAKPVIPFLQQWQQFLDENRNVSAKTVAVVGAGVAGVEVALAMHHRIQALRQELRLNNANWINWKWHLISNSEVLSGHNALVRRRARKALQQAGFDCRTGAKLEAVEGNRLQLSDGSSITSDFTVLCTPAAPVQELADSHLPLTNAGFIPVNECLQVAGTTTMFAVGDIAAFPQPLAKAGVYAVRQGPVLAANLKRAVTGERLQPFVPQRRFLKLITLGDKNAMASRGWLYCAGEWVWRWKNRIDTGFMEKYQR